MRIIRQLNGKALFTGHHPEAYAVAVSQADFASLCRSLGGLAIVIAAIIYMGFFNWTQHTRPDQQAVVSGRLIEWSELHGSKGSRTLRFTISGYRSDFRIDPSVVRYVMGRKIPVGFLPGAKIEITVDATELASPVHPMLNPNASIIWVNGLSVEGRREFNVIDVVEHEQRDFIWWIPLLAVPLALFGYSAMLWRRGQDSGDSGDTPLFPPPARSRDAEQRNR